MIAVIKEYGLTHHRCRPQCRQSRRHHHRRSRRQPHSHPPPHPPRPPPPGPTSSSLSPNICLTLVTTGRRTLFVPLRQVQSILGRPTFRTGPFLDLPLSLASLSDARPSKSQTLHKFVLSAQPSPQQPSSFLSSAGSFDNELVESVQDFYVKTVGAVWRP